ncbi:MAG: hypothetical protein DRN14_03415 [Thermoplasmata archaeon]|nr:MAG: hypothetical protein DRN14_03415 [Thermoplasmata archaeon]
MDVDAILFALLSPARRELLRRLSRAPQYPLGLSRALGLSPQAIVKHLYVLEEAGLVEQVGQVRGGLGAPRTYYGLSRSVSVYVDIGPGLFSLSVEEWPGDVGLGPDPVRELERIEKRLRELEEERLKLLRAKSELMRRLGLLRELHSL